MKPIMAKKQTSEVKRQKGSKKPKSKAIWRTVINRQQIMNVIRDNQILKNNIQPIKQRGKHINVKILTRQEFKSAMEVSEKYDCPICLDILVKPFQTPCGHMFCLHCFEQSYKNNQFCPLCKANYIFTLAPNEDLQDLILAYVSLLPSNKQKLYNDRVRSFNEFQEVATLQPPYAVGMLVDYKPNHDINQWQAGEITAVTIKKDYTSLQIRQLSQDPDSYCSQIYITSQRCISTFGYHTQGIGFSRIELLEHRLFKRKVQQILKKTTSINRIRRQVQLLQEQRFQRRNLKSYMRKVPVPKLLNPRPNFNPMEEGEDSYSSQDFYDQQS